MSARNIVCWVFPAHPSVFRKSFACAGGGRGGRLCTAVCSEQGRRGEDEGAAHCEQA